MLTFEEREQSPAFQTRVAMELSCPLATLTIKRNVPSSLTVPQHIAQVNPLRSLRKVTLIRLLASGATQLRVQL